MIFLTIGTERHPFDRAVDYIVNTVQKHNIQDEFVFQLGSCVKTPPFGKSHKFIPFTHVVDNIKKAKIVIVHGGVGSVNMCLYYGKKPIVIPRLGSLQEAIDDHQITYSRYMHKNGYVHLAESEEQFEQVFLQQLKSPDHPVDLTSSQDKQKLCSFLDSLITPTQ